MAEEPGTSTRIFSEMEIRHLLAREVQRCTRYQDFLTLCLVRALYPGGPLAEMEAAVARRIAEMLRSTDIVGAIGPDIAVLLVHTPDSDAGMIANRIRDRVQSGPFEAVVAPPPGRVTLSIGLASFPTDATSDGGLLTQAQAQLQAAHQTGRPSAQRP
jgi:predicted signal transduction protein with EAL and GGDEF domain